MHENELLCPPKWPRFPPYTERVFSLFSNDLYFDLKKQTKLAVDTMSHQFPVSDNVKTWKAWLSFLLGNLELSAPKP